MKDFAFWFALFALLFNIGVAVWQWWLEVGGPVPPQSFKGVALIDVQPKFWEPGDPT